MNQNTNNSKGFVLAELIVAIALIAVVSGVILQMFLSASSVNDASRTMDSASSISTQTLERLKLSGLEFNDAFFANAEVTEEGEGYKIVMAYDKAWQSIPPGAADTFATVTAAMLPDKTREGINPVFQSNGGERMTGTLYVIDLHIALAHKEGDLLSVRSAKYILHTEGAA